MRRRRNRPRYRRRAPARRRGRRGHRRRLRRALPLRDARVRRAPLPDARAHSSFRSPAQRTPAGRGRRARLDDTRRRRGSTAAWATARPRERQRRLPHQRPRSERSRPRVRGAHGPRRGRPDGRQHRVRERARHRHPAQRPDRGRGAPAYARSADVAHSRQLDQGRARPLDGRGRDARGPHVPPGLARRRRAAHGRPRGARSGLRPRSRDGLAAGRPATREPEHLAGLRWLQRRARAGGRVRMSVALEAVSLLTGWGPGTDALPADAAQAAGGRAVIPLGRPALDGDRFRRATRECLLGVAAVDALLRESGIDRDIIRGCSTALLYVTAAAYGSSNQAFVVAEALRQARTTGAVSGGTYFAYTAPSTMAGEVAIEFELTGAYGILSGGGAATIGALWQATRVMADGRCERALVLAVETFEECADLYSRGRWLVKRPLVEAAACALLVPGARRVRYEAPRTPSALETLDRKSVG